METTVEKKAPGTAAGHFVDASIAFARRHPILAANAASVTALAACAPFVPLAAVAMGADLSLSCFYGACRIALNDQDDSSVVLAALAGILIAVVSIEPVLEINDKATVARARDAAVAKATTLIQTGDVADNACVDYKQRTSLMTWHNSKRRVCVPRELLAQSPEGFLANIDGKLVAVTRASAQPAPR